MGRWGGVVLTPELTPDREAEIRCHDAALYCANWTPRDPEDAAYQTVLKNQHDLLRELDAARQHAERLTQALDRIIDVASRDLGAQWMFTIREIVRNARAREAVAGRRAE